MKDLKLAKQSLLLFFWSLSVLGFASNPEKSDSSGHTDEHPFVQIFSKGHFGGNIRNFTMTTLNKGELKDYYANAMGASVWYETANFHGFTLGLKGVFIHKLFSNDLNEVDPLVGKASRFERQLFDLEDPENYNDLDRLEELYLRYEHGKFQATLGKMEVKTPIVNPHHSRMKPKIFSGIWVDAQPTDWLEGSIGWFTHASPRSTVRWFTVAEAIGIYGNGCLPDGSPAHYHEHVSTKGLGSLGLKARLAPHLHLESWDYFLENISNTSLLRCTYDQDSAWEVGVMYLNQFGVGEGGSAEIEHRYHELGVLTHVLSARLGYHTLLGDISLNGTMVCGEGKYIFPREFGKDPFFTTLSRSWLEGLGQAKSVGLKYHKEFHHLEADIQWEHVMTDDNFSDFSLNKYAQVSYDQINFDTKYHFDHVLKGLDLEFLYILRRSTHEVDDPRYLFNSSDFHQINLISNFHF